MTFNMDDLLDYMKKDGFMGLDQGLSLLVQWYRRQEKPQALYDSIGFKKFQRLMACDEDYRKVKNHEGLILIMKVFASTQLSTVIGSQLLENRAAAQWSPTRTLYEIIPGGEPIRFFANFDLRASRHLDTTAHEALLSLLARAFNHWLRQVWDTTIGHPEDVLTWTAIESCDGPKFSCRFVTNTWLPDIGVQGRAAAMSFMAFLHHYIQTNELSGGEFSVDALIDAGRRKSGKVRHDAPRGASRDTHHDDLVHILALAAEKAKNGALLDLSVYTSNSQLRVVGSPKFNTWQGDHRSQFPTRIKTGNDHLRVEILDDDFKLAWINVAKIWGDVNCVVDTLVIPGELWMRPDVKYERRPYLTAEKRLNRMLWFDVNGPGPWYLESAKRDTRNGRDSFARTDPETPVRWEECPRGAKRASATGAEHIMETVLGANVAYTRHSVDTAAEIEASKAAGEEVIADELDRHDQEVYHYVDGAEYIINAENRQKLAEQLRRGEVCFCPECETVVERKRGSFYLASFRTRGIGTPSAVVCAIPDRSTLAIKCWNASCLATTVITSLETWSARHPANFIIHRIDLPGGVIRAGGRVKIPTQRLFILDAPTACGQTELVGEYIKAKFKEPRSVIGLTSHRGFSRVLSRAWGLANYQDTEWQNDARVRRRSVVVGMNSLRILTEKPDLLIVDEAAFVIELLVRGTLNQALEYIRLLRTLVSGKTQVIVLQQGISESNVQWWRLLGGFSEDEVYHVYVDELLSLGKANIVTCPFPTQQGDIKPEILLALMYHIGAVYISHLRQPGANGNPRGKIYIAANVDHTCASIGVLLSRMGRGWSLENGESVGRAEQRQRRIKVLYGRVEEEWIERFQADPDGVSEEVDVLISTANQVGASVGSKFTANIAVLQNGVLTHEQEFQMTNKLRPKTTNGLTPLRLFCIEEGVTGSMLIDSDIEFNVTGDDKSLINMAKTMTRNALNNTFIRHQWLWLRKYRNRGVGF